MFKFAGSSSRLIIRAEAPAICTIIMLAVASTALARPFRLEILPDRGENFGCATCHMSAGGGEWNAFGQDYGRTAVPAGDAYTTELGLLDSDGDGFTNDQEFAALTSPGDATGKPSGDTSGKKLEVLLSGYFHIAGRLLALVGFVLILAQYVLSSRIRLVERRWGLDSLFIGHRRIGLLSFAFVALHPILLVAADLVRGNTFPLPPLTKLGIFTVALLLATTGAAVLHRRLRLKYETWKNIHRFGYLILPMVFIHSFFGGRDLDKFGKVIAPLGGQVIPLRAGGPVL